MPFCFIIIDLINGDEFDKKIGITNCTVFKRRGNHLVLDASENVSSFTPIANNSVILISLN